MLQKEHGEEESQQEVAKLMPSKVKNRRKIQTDDGVSYVLYHSTCHYCCCYLYCPRLSPAQYNLTVQNHGLYHHSLFIIIVVIFVIIFTVNITILFT